MALTANDTTVPKGVWTDLYLASGIPVGTALMVINTGSTSMKIAIKATAPTGDKFGLPLYSGPNLSAWSILAGEPGLWAYSPDGVGYVNLQV